MNVLVADDDPVVRHFVEASIQSLGHKVASFPDGESAWTAVDSFQPHVVVSDWRMPGVDGLELCRRIRTAKGSCVYFILISSAFGQEPGEGGEVFRSAGVDDVIPKPMAIDQLWNRLRVAEARTA